MDLEAIWTEKLEDKLRRNLLECVAYTELDLLTWHPAYVEANKIANKISRKYLTVSKHDIEVFVWNKLEQIQQWILEEKEKNPTQNWKMVLGSKKSVYIRNLSLYTADPRDYPSSLNEDVYGMILNFFGKVISLLREPNAPIGVNQKIQLFHCINMFSHAQFGSTTTNIWRSCLDSSGQLILGSNDFKALQTIADLGNFLEGNQCLLCEESGATENNNASVKNIIEHVKNSHAFKTIPCSVSGCNMFLSTKKLLNSHLSKFHKLKELHHCVQCQKSFSSKIQLTLHENGVHGKGKRIRRKMVTEDEDDRDDDNNENEITTQDKQSDCVPSTSTMVSNNVNPDLEKLSREEIVSRLRIVLAENVDLREENLRLRDIVEKDRRNYIYSDQATQTETEDDLINLDPGVFVNEVQMYQLINPADISFFQSIGTDSQTNVQVEAIPVQIVDTIAPDHVNIIQPLLNLPQDNVVLHDHEEKENEEPSPLDVDLPDETSTNFPILVENENGKRSLPEESQLTACRSRAPSVGLFKKLKS